jgi:hypothetical protein
MLVVAATCSCEIKRQKWVHASFCLKIHCFTPFFNVINTCLASKAISCHCLAAGHLVFRWCQTHSSCSWCGNFTSWFLWILCTEVCNWHTIVARRAKDMLVVTATCSCEIKRQEWVHASFCLKIHCFAPFFYVINSCLASKTISCHCLAADHLVVGWCQR